MMKERFLHAWQSAGAQPERAALVFGEMRDAYQGPARHYHTLEHIQECLDLYTGLRGQAKREFEVELAIFFHDVVYDPTRSDNEAQSAEWARSRLSRAGVENEVIGRVASLIVSTQEHAPELQGDHALLSDIDLAILGAAPERYGEYQRQVRAEYAFVPQPLFDQARHAFLAKMLARQCIFHSRQMRETHGAQAIINLQAAMHDLDPTRRE